MGNAMIQCVMSNAGVIKTG